MRPFILSMVLLGATSASAVGVSLEGAGGYWFDQAPQFQLTLGVHQWLGRHVRLGLRSGVVLNLPDAPQVAIPIDVGLRIAIHRFFLEPLGGLWFMLGDPRLLRAHAGMALGWMFTDFDIGLEASWLQPSPLLLFRFSYNF